MEQQSVVIKTPWGEVTRNTRRMDQLVRHPQTGVPVQPDITFWAHVPSAYIIAFRICAPDYEGPAQLSQGTDRDDPRVQWLVDNGHLILGAAHG